MEINRGHYFQSNVRIISHVVSGEQRKSTARFSYLSFVALNAPKHPVSPWFLLFFSHLMNVPNLLFSWKRTHNFLYFFCFNSEFVCFVFLFALTFLEAICIETTVQF